MGSWAVGECTGWRSGADGFRAHSSAVEGCDATQPQCSCGELIPGRGSGRMRWSVSRSASGGDHTEVGVVGEEAVHAGGQEGVDLSFEVADGVRIGADAVVDR
jgi:hypothetical protein